MPLSTHICMSSAGLTIVPRMAGRPAEFLLGSVSELRPSDRESERSDTLPKRNSAGRPAILGTIVRVRSKLSPPRATHLLQSFLEERYGEHAILLGSVSELRPSDRESERDGWYSHCRGASHSVLPGVHGRSSNDQRSIMADRRWSCNSTPEDLVEHRVRHVIVRAAFLVLGNSESMRVGSSPCPRHLRSGLLACYCRTGQPVQEKGPGHRRYDI
jgi:hypothetical protein